MVGNLSNYHKLDVLRCFFKLVEPKSRLQLVKYLEMGEGTIRSLLNILKDSSLINSTKEGHILSKKGLKKLTMIKDKLDLPSTITLKAFYPNMKKIAVHIKNVPTVKSFITLRDIAVKNGAEGAMIFKYDDRLSLPQHKGRFPLLEQSFDFKKGDLLIVAFSPDLRWAEIGALAIVDYLVDVKI